MSKMTLPRRSNDGQPASAAASMGPSASNIDEFRGRSSSETTPKTRIPLNMDKSSGQGRRPSKPSLSGSSSIGVGGSDYGFAAGTVASGQNLGTRSGSRNEMYPTRDAAASPVPSISSSLPRSSPQKPQRTLDNKIISRELERLGFGVSHFHGGPSSSALVAAASASTLSLPTSSAGMSESRSAPMLTVASSMSFPSPSPHDTPLGALHIQVLPLFNGEPLRSPIEELNILVRDHLTSVLSRSPSKAMATLAADITELVGTGMLNLDAKLTGIDDEKFLTRLVEVWNFFWVQVLPYLEGIFLPLQIDPLLHSLGKAPKGPRRNSSSCADISSAPEAARLDVRKLVLVAFRDAIVYPRADKLQELLAVSATTKDQRGIGIDKSDDYQRPRIQQMLLVLHSTSGPMTQERPTPGEYATRHLLRMIRPHASSSNAFAATTARNAVHRYDYPLGPEIHPAARAGWAHPLRGGIASLAAGAPRDRRGRIVKLDSPGAEAWRSQAAFQESDDDGELSSPTAHREHRGQLDDWEEVVADEDEADADLDADDESEMGHILGNTTPTLTRPNAHSRSKAPVGPVANESRRDRRNHHVSEEEDEEEDYGQPVQRTITTSPLHMPTRV